MDVPDVVRVAFSLKGTAEPLSGGMGVALRFGGVVIKPAPDVEEASFLAEVMQGVEVDETRVRVARPVPARDGSWVAEGWAAWQWLAGSGRRLEQPWQEALDAADELSRGLSGVDASSLLATRTHRWAIADQMAWDERPSRVDHPAVADLVDEIQALVRPVPELEAQLIHADLYVNLLFEPALPPGVIDFSPLWRPADVAVAVYAVDALGRDGDHRLLALIAERPNIDQLLVRAALYRVLVRDRYLTEVDPSFTGDLGLYQQMLAHLKAFLAAR